MNFPNQANMLPYYSVNSEHNKSITRIIRPVIFMESLGTQKHMLRFKRIVYYMKSEIIVRHDGLE